MPAGHANPLQREQRRLLPALGEGEARHRDVDAVHRERGRPVPVGEPVARFSVEAAGRLGQGDVLLDEAPRGGQREAAQAEVAGGPERDEGDLAFPVHDAATDQRRGDGVGTVAPG